MNLHRHPLNGRNFEYFSEDPLLTGKIAAAQLRGMNRYQVTGAMKHFAANNQEYHRRKYNSVVSERALREIYLKGFEIAVKEGGAYAVMTTYGAVNGLWTAGNYDLVRSQNDIYMVVQDSGKNSNGDNLAECLRDGTLDREVDGGGAGELRHKMVFLTGKTGV